MNRIASFWLLALLASTPTIAICHQAQAADRNAQVNIGWTKKQVQAALGKPDRTSKDKNIWYYGKRVIQFTNDKVSGFPGAAG